MLRAILRGGSFMLLAFITSNCVDQIDLSQGVPLSDGIALSGRMWIQGEEASVVFRGGRLFRFTSNRSERLINAEVSVELSDGTDHPLAYNIDKDVFTVAFILPRSRQDGLQARIRVNTVNAGNYLSKWDPIPEEMNPGTLTARQVFDDDGNPVRINYELKAPARRSDGSGIPFLYRFSRSYRVLSAIEPIRFCYITDTLNRFDYTLLEPQADYVGELRTIEIFTDEVDWRYAEGHYLNVTQDPVSDATYEYFRNFVSYVDRDQSIFEAPPGNLPGNFSSLTNPEQERIYGLFYVTRPQVVRSGIPAGVVDVEPFCIPIGNHRRSICRGSCGTGGGPRPSYWTF